MCIFFASLFQKRIRQAHCFILDSFNISTNVYNVFLIFKKDNGPYF